MMLAREMMRANDVLTVKIRYFKKVKIALSIIPVFPNDGTRFKPIHSVLCSTYV